MTPTHTTQLDSLTLANYRCFRQLRVELDPRLTVLVADNGVGKTTVLDAIAVSLSAFVGAFRTGRRFGINKNDVLLKVMDREVLEMEPQYPSSLRCEGRFDHQSVRWAHSMQTSHSHNTFKEAKPLIAIGERLQQQLADEETNAEVVLPVVAYYGTGRLWKQKKQTDNKKRQTEQFSRTVGYLDCLDPDSSYAFFVEWLRKTTTKHNELRDQNIERHGDKGLSMATPYQDLLDAVAQAVDSCLGHTGWRKMRYSAIHETPVVEHPIHGALIVDQLSDGIRNMIGLVADIAYRAATLNKLFRQDAPRHSPGIVLIDEVDMHLHPAWQQRVLPQLLATFENIQFIVTTHSPQVISTIKSKHVRLLSLGEDGIGLAAQPLAESYAYSNADVLEAVMHTQPFPTVRESRDLERYRQLAEQGDLDTEELTRLRDRLEQSLGPTHPELIRLAKVIQRRELLG